ncbi:hypothetical protein [Okeania sp. SIO1F9]|uniref:hypothetical protein n=1 Tax=Okeania sp. SIO1F9 TaxID=2607813 RepID=UPI00144B6810|nr:hypothetical protein [Okeania sp. SIO1F9]NET77650.1 hypothetical protein [Okeania sp. SIO1F9]
MGSIQPLTPLTTEFLHTEQTRKYSNCSLENQKVFRFGMLHLPAVQQSAVSTSGFA